MRRILLLLPALLLLACDEAAGPGAVPDAPEHVRANLRLDEIEIVWLDVSSGEDIFLVEVSVDGGAWLRLVETPAGVARATYPDPQPGTEYAFRVSACNQAGCSEAVETRVDTHEWGNAEVRISSIRLTEGDGVAITVVVSLGEVVTDVSVTLREAANPLVFVMRSEQIQRSGYLRPYYIFGLKPGTKYTVQAFARNRFGSAQSAITTFTTADLVPPTFADLHVSAVTPTSATVNARIHPGGSRVDSWFTLVVDGAVTSTAPQQIMVNPQYRNAAERPLSSHTFSNLLPGTTYYWNVVARNTNGYTHAVVRPLSFTTPAQ